MNEFSPYLIEILKEMCKRVNANYDEIDFKINSWVDDEGIFHTNDYYHLFSWTKDEEDSFKKWMIDYLYNNKQARKEFMSFPKKNKKRIAACVDEFLWNHGWKLEK